MRDVLNRWNSLIRQAVVNGDFRKALLLFRQMKKSHLHPNNLTFPFVAKACAKLLDLKLSRMMHAHVVKTPHYSDAYVHTALVDMYVKCGRLHWAHQLFDEMPARDLVSRNALIVGFAREGVFDKAFLLFYRMRAAGVSPDAITLMGLTHLVSRLKSLILLGTIHCFVMKCGFDEVVSVANTLIAGYAKCHDSCSAKKVFNGVPFYCLTVVSWNAMISGLAYFEEWEKSIEVYKWMLRYGYRPDASTILNLLSSISWNSLLCGMLVHAHGVKLGCDSDITVLNTLVCVYSKCDDLDSARCIFDSMSVRSRVTWTVMIGAYSDKDDFDEALSLLHKMEAAGEKPDSVTIFHLISACGIFGRLEVGRWIGDYTVSKGLNKDSMVCNALLDMYAKCGSMEHAEKVFLAMDDETKNVVSWTALISGFALNGKPQEALDHFNRMLEFGVKPNQVTFLAVLQACTHAGLLEKGWEIFNMMSDEYFLNPRLDHYACVADLLGRKGKLKEAMEFIEEMPFPPDAGIWGALLSACKIHQNLEIGEYAASHLFRLEPEAAAPYVEMANIYANAKEWNRVAAMRSEMKAKQVEKSPGKSVVQIDGKCYSFTVEDRFHMNRCEVLEMLDNLVLLLKDDRDDEELQSWLCL